MVGSGQCSVVEWSGVECGVVWCSKGGESSGGEWTV